MREVSENFGIKDLAGLELEQVCVGQFQVILRFDKDASITCNTGLKVFDQACVEPTERRYTANLANIFEFLGKKAKQLTQDESENLTLVFEDDQSIEITKDQTGYESYEVWKGDDFLIV